LTPNSSRKRHCLLFSNQNPGRARPSLALGSRKCLRAVNKLAFQRNKNLNKKNFIVIIIYN
jgi:hypothetical protein